VIHIISATVSALESDVKENQEAFFLHCEQTNLHLIERVKEAHTAITAKSMNGS